MNKGEIKKSKNFILSKECYYEVEIKYVEVVKAEDDTFRKHDHNSITLYEQKFNDLNLQKLVRSIN